MANLSLRDEIATNKDVQDLFRNYTMENGAVVCIDRDRAYDHVRQCMNDLKRTSSPSTLQLQVKVRLINKVMRLSTVILASTFCLCLINRPLSIGGKSRH